MRRGVWVPALAERLNPFLLVCAANQISETAQLTPSFERSDESNRMQKRKLRRNYNPGRLDASFPGAEESDCWFRGLCQVGKNPPLPTS